MRITYYKGMYTLVETRKGVTSTLASCNDREILEKVKQELESETVRKRQSPTTYGIIACSTSQ